MKRLIHAPLMVIAAVVLLLPGAAMGQDDGVTSLPEFIGPFPDTENMVFHGQVTPSDMGALPVPGFGIAKGFVSDVAAYTSPGGEQYALQTHTGGISFVRVTDPDDIEFVGTIPLEVEASLNFTHLWGDPDSWGEYGYFTREGFGEPFTTDLIIVELANLDDLGEAAPATDVSAQLNVSFVAPGGYDGAHNIEIDDEGFAYLPGTHLEHGAANNACGLDDPPAFNMLILDVGSDPLNPQVAGCVPNAEHDIYIVNDYDGPEPDHQGKDIAFVFDGGSTNTFVWDVTDRSNVTVLSQFSLAEKGMFFSHNGVPTDDLRHLFIGDEIDELLDAAINGTLKPEIGTYIVDITDLDDPAFDERYTDGSIGIDHNFVVADGKLFVASYNSGTRVFDIVDEADGSITLSPIAHMDTEPRLPNNIFNLNQENRFVSNFLGQWGIDRFDDGTIIASDLNNGLIVMSLSDTPCSRGRCR